jgi:hypothetical protein
MPRRMSSRRRVTTSPRLRSTGDGLVTVFGVATATALIGALASALRGHRPRTSQRPPRDVIDPDRAINNRNGVLVNE